MTENNHPEFQQQHQEASYTQSYEGIQPNKLLIEMHTAKDDDRPVYLAGNFNAWKVREERYKMHKISEGRYEYTFDNADALPHELVYKYTKGNWSDAEADIYGCKTQNRTAFKDQGVEIDYVPRWFSGGISFPRHFLPRTELVQQDFYMPQLDKTRRVQILLPSDYDDSSRRYPVLYLQDGQNLFDPHAPFGNWAINEKLAVLKEYDHGDLIVVAIDHGEVSRINEFSPLSSIQLGIGQGEGKKYLDFMVETLKPYIDEHYRTLSHKKFTGIGGSSMGGLISLYGGIMYPNVFSRLMVFSPSLWIYPDVYKEVGENGALADTRLYLYAGGRESQGMLPKVQRLLKSINESSQNTNINLVIDPNGTHTESRWGIQFPEAVEWLFF